MTAITTLSLSSPITQGSAAFAVGQGFKKGDIPAGQYLTTDQLNVSCIPLAKWNDGSLKHARIVGSVSLTANVPLALNLSSTTSSPVGSQLTSANITAANPSASVQCGSLGTVTLSSLLGHEIRTVASTPQMVECHYRAQIPGTLLSVWFYVSLWANGAVKVRAAVENGYLDDGAGNTAANADIAYIPTITIGGTVVYNNGGASLTHCKNTRWFASGWIGSDPQVTPSHNTTYLRSTKLVPNYALSTATSGQLDALTQTYTPMSTGGIPAAMAAPGDNPTIALLPKWDAAYVGTGDARAYRAVIAASNALNSFPIVWRDFTTKDVIKPNSFATWSLYGPSQSNSRGPDAGTNGAGWEINHHPGIGYTAYLLTGDYWHYETLLLQLSMLWVCRGIMSINDPAHGSGTGRVLAHEVRGGSWSIRTMSITCGIMPETQKAAGQVGAEYRELLTNNMIYWKSLVDQPGMNQLGFLYEYSSDNTLRAYGDGRNAPWMHFWWVQAQGFGSDLEPLPDMTVYNAVRNYSYKSIVGILGAVSSGYAFDCASTYGTKISDGISTDPTTWYSDWATVYINTFSIANNGGGAASIPHNNTLLNVGNLNDSTDQTVPSPGGSGGPTEAYYGRWGYLLPAIAYAVDHNAPGAAQSWARVSGASNYSDLTSSFNNQSSQWGIFPRNAAAGAISVTHAIGPAIRFGRMRAGHITISKYHGNGIPASAIPTGFDQPALLLNNIDSANDPAGTVYRLDMPTKPASGTMTINEDSSFFLLGAAAGTYTGQEDIYKNGILTYSEPYSFTIGGSDSTAPTMQGSLVVSNITSNTFKVTWQAATDNVGVTGYEVSLDGISYTDNSTSLFTTFTGLVPGHSYTAYVRAYDAANLRSAPLTANAVTPATVPGVPTAVTATAGNGLASVSFLAPSFNGGVAISGYTVTSSTGQFATGTGSPINVTVPNGVAVTFTVHATNAIGNSPESTPSNSVTPASPTGVPSAPTNIIATAGNGSVSVAFTAPISNGGATITSYTVTASTGQTATGMVSPIAVAVPNNIAVTFTVHATNSAGNSAESSASNSVTPAVPITTPGAPTNVVATAGMNSVTVSFNAPASNGGASITGYTATASTGQTNTGSTSPITITMPAGIPAVFTVHATNSVGNGPESTPSNSTAAYLAPDVTKPMMQGFPTVSNITYNSATISWPAATDDRGVVAYGYSLNGGAYTTVFSNSINITGLQSATVYTINVRAYDAANNASDPISVDVQTTLAPVQQTGTVTVSTDHPRAVYVDVTGFAPNPGHAFAPYGKPIAVQDPSAVLDYVFDWTLYLAATGSKIVDNEFYTDVGITDKYDYNSTQTAGWIRAGVSGQVATFTNRITTDDGRVDERSVYIKFKDQ
jgi:hypothetical protein